MKKMVFIAVSVVIFLFINFMVFQKERVLRSGQTVLLQLGSRDPRSLMQGDYMVLRYRLAGEAADFVEKAGGSGGRLVIRLDGHNVGRFVRIHRGEPLADGEWLLKYRRRGGLRLGAESFFFQEGNAGYYRDARYGELRVAPDGDSILVGLRDVNFEPLGPIFD